MTKFWTFITKFAKISTYIEWVYKGILIAIDTITLIRKEIIEIKPDFKYDELLLKIIDYLTKAAEVIEVVLRWFGRNISEITAEAKRDFEAMSAEEKTTDLGGRLDGVNSELDKIIEANK